VKGEGCVVLAHGVVHLTQPAHGQTLAPLISAFPKQKMLINCVPVYLKNVAMWEGMGFNLLQRCRLLFNEAGLPHSGLYSAEV